MFLTSSSGLDRRVHAGMMIVAGIFLASIFFSIAVNSISLGLLGILWLLLLRSHRSWKDLSTPLDWYFLAYVIAELLASALSADPVQSFTNARRLLLIGIVYFFAANLQKREEVRRYFWILEGAAIVVGCLGIGKLLHDASGANVRLGVFQFYMTTAGLMACAAAFLLPLALHRNTPRFERLAAIFGLLPLLIVLYATVTRGAYMGFLAGALLVILVRNWKMIIPLAVLLLVAIIFAPPYVAGRIQSIVDPAHPENVMRIFIWTAGWRIFLLHPLVGVGDIDLGDLLRQYADPGYLGLWGHMHNVPLQFLVTLGVVGTIAAIVLFVRLVLMEWHTYRLVRGDWLYSSIALGSLAVFATIMTQGLTEWTFGDQEIALVLWTTVGFALAVGRIGVPARETEPRRI